MLQSMGLQRVGHNLATEQQQQQRGKVECPRAWLLNICILNICILRGSLFSAQHSEYLMSKVHVEQESGVPSSSLNPTNWEALCARWRRLASSR